jgi:predicted transcriptional regulator
MSTLEIKLEIFDKLKNVEDLSLLKKIRNLLTNVNKAETYQLNEYELDMLKESEEDIKHGRLYTNEEVIAEENKWLNE